MKLVFANLLNEGGPTFMYPILFMLIACVILAIMAFVKKGKQEKFISLLKHISLFALVWGFLGFFMGLIQMFDSISAFDGNVATPLLAGGLKVALLAPSFGLVTFLVARIGLILMTVLKK